MYKTKFYSYLFVTTLALMSTMIVSCSDDDNVTQQVVDKLKTELVGTWYGEYASEGEITSGDANSISGYYIKAVQGLEFKSNGTGTCYQYLCNVAGEPLSIYGGTQDPANGQFTYTVAADSIITITRVGDGNESHSKTWNLTLGSDGLKGTDGGEAFTMHPSKDWEKANLSAWEQTLRTGHNDDQSERSFITNWEECESVQLIGIGERYLPWYGASSQDIPEEIIFDMAKRDGWEMAFCELNDPRAPDIHMFGLYNRYTGVLRVYQYLEGNTNWGNELLLNVNTLSGTKDRHPYYNNMAYGIPLDREYGSPNLRDNLNIWNGTEYFTPFEYFVSAYTVSSQSPTVVPHWHCFDLDFSAYVPKKIKLNGKEVDFDWRHSVDSQRTLLQMNTRAQKNSNIDLWGTMVGNMAGEFISKGYNKSKSNNPTMKKWSTAIGLAGSLFSQSLTWGNCCCSISKNSPWGSFQQRGGGGGNAQGGGVNPPGGDIGGGGDAGAQAQAPAFHVKRRNPLIAALPWVIAVGAGLCTLTSTILNNINGTESWQETTGNVDFYINSEISMEGVMKSFEPLPEGGLNLKPYVLDATNPKSSFGKGCFGLAQDPVVYVSTEDLLCASERVNMRYKANEKAYESVSFSKDSVRLVSFFDPSSVKLCLNTDIYHNIRDLTLTLNYGVDAANYTGNTDGYRTFMGLNDRGTFQLSEKMSKVSMPRLHALSPDSLLGEERAVQGVPDSIRLVEQPGGQYLRFYGNSNSYFGKNCIMDPQVFVPYNGSKVYDALVPDFFVTVAITFACDECDKVEICKAFLPKVQFIKHNDLATWYTKLSDYYGKCNRGEAVGALVNEPKIPIYDYASDEFLLKNIRMLEKIK